MILIVLCILISLISFPVSGQSVKKMTFIFIPKLVHPWYQDVITGMNNAKAFLEKTGQVKLTLEWMAPPKADVTQHVNMIESAIRKKPNGLAVAVLDPSADVPVIKDAIAAGIPTICFDTDAPESGRITFVGRTDYLADGREMAKVLAKAIKGKGEIAILLGSLGAPNHKLRVQGFKEEIAKYPDIKIVAEEADNDDLERAVSLTETILRKHPNLAGIYGCNATAPIGAARAVEDAGKSGKVIVVGMDDLPEMIEFMKKGTVYAMSVQRVKEIGFWSVIYLWAMNEGHTVPPFHDTGSLVVFKEQLGTYSKWK